MKNEKSVKNMDDTQEFLKILNKLTYRHRVWDVWSDFITLFACSISNSVDKRFCKDREELYLRTIKKYDEHERDIFPQMIAKTLLALDNNTEQDFLGNIFMKLSLGDKRRGQYFTPYNICRFMAEVNTEDAVSIIKENGYITINDPTCGSGALLIAGIHSVKRRLEKVNLNFQDHIFIVGQDVDFVIALMAYIQISLMGVAGCIKIGDSLTEPVCSSDTLENYWFTPMYFINDVTKKKAV